VLRTLKVGTEILNLNRRAHVFRCDSCGRLLIVSPPRKESCRIPEGFIDLELISSQNMTQFLKDVLFILHKHSHLLSMYNREVLVIDH
jgi:hypothetical protein